MKQKERRRRRPASLANRRSATQGKGAPGNQSDGDFSPSPSPSPSSSPQVSPVPSREQSPAFGLEPDLGAGPGRTWTPGLGPGLGGARTGDYQSGHDHDTCSDVELYMSTAESAPETGGGALQLIVTASNRGLVKMSFLRMLRRRPSPKTLLLKAKGLRGDRTLVNGLLAQVAEFAQEWRKNEVALKLLALTSEI